MIPVLLAVALYRVVVAAPRYSIVLSDHGSEFRSICGLDTKACTHILGSAVHADCTGTGEHWHATLDISFVPYIYIGDWSLRGMLIAHEHEHLLDLDEAAERFARDASRLDYQSRQRCEDDAPRLSVALQGTLESAAAASMKLRR
jgi:hypothetical protein